MLGVKLHSYNFVRLTRGCLAGEWIKKCLDILARVEGGNFVVAENVLRLNALKWRQISQLPVEDVELGLDRVGLFRLQQRRWADL
jgi:hypothetical protein